MKIKNREDLIRGYIDFFKLKKHAEIPSSSLIPENDPTVLFTTAGMHPLVPYLLGQKHPLGWRLVNVQKCIRTVDIDSVGDEVHHTFFEMLGNWSLGDYWKNEAIEFSWEFLTDKKWLGLDKSRLAVSCFKGDKNTEKDTESAKVWEGRGVAKERIVFLGKDDNWWGPAGEIGPCGPDTEMFYFMGEKVPKKFDSSDKQWVEIWNDVFMQYEKTKDGNYVELKQKNVDTGMGVERTIAVLNGLSDNYLTPGFLPIIKEIEKISEKDYLGREREMRIIADHVRAAVFILGDFREIKPGNVGQGYVLRRLIRRAVRYGRLIGIKDDFLGELAKIVIRIYGKNYSELRKNGNFILKELEIEEEKFRITLDKGLRKFGGLVEKGKKLSGKNAFLLFQSYGFPIEMTLEMAKEIGVEVDIKGFEKEFAKHQKLSRTASSGQFKSGLADGSEKTTRLHTATHLLNAALKIVLKNEDIVQKGSNVNPERLRFDFNFDRKLTNSELKDVEDLVSLWIKKGIDVVREEMPVKEAFASGAEGEFGAKYPSVVSVYTIKGVSREICTGPHVKNTKEIGHFKIKKEESSSAGVRRIKATVE